MALHSLGAHSCHLSHLLPVMVMKITCSVAHLLHLLQYVVVKPRQELLVKVCTSYPTFVSIVNRLGYLRLIAELNPQVL